MIKPNVITEYPVAYESFDHIQPYGTAQDNTKNLSYTRELIERFGPNVKYMDLGCSGGGFVAQMLEEGGFAVGVEGSDYSKKNKRAEWANYPDNLFTADVSKPFTVVDVNNNNEIIQFDVISMFDVLEHFEKHQLAQVFDNVKRHLKDTGIFVAGISVEPCGHYHPIVEPVEWWLDVLDKNGFEKAEELDYFGRHAIGLDAVLKKKS